MATWTELLEKAKDDPANGWGVLLETAPAALRDMLIDLATHPNISAVRAVLVITDEGPYPLPGRHRILLTLPAGESMASGATAPGAKPTTTVPALHQRHVRDVLSSAPVTAYTDDLEPGQAPPPPAPTAVGPSVTPSAGWLDGLTYKPREKTSPGGIILPGDA